MIFKWKYIISLSLIFLVQYAFAQDNSIFEDDRLIYNKEASGGVLIHNFGWGLNFSKYKKQTIDKYKYFEFQFSFVHHPKQQRVASYYYQDARGFYYGKLNTFFVLRALYGKKHVIGHKIRSSGVELAYKWGIGPSFGFLKPVYLEIYYEDVGFPVVEQYDPELHDFNNIVGRANGLKGFDQLMFRPGVFFKFGMQIEFSAKKQGLSGLEAGIALDAYLQEIELMARIDNLQFFPVLYFNIFFGKKYNQM